MISLQASHSNQMLEILQRDLNKPRTLKNYNSQLFTLRIKRLSIRSFRKET